MHSYYMQIITVFIVVMFLILIHLQARYTSKNSKFLKKKVLSLSGFFSKENVEEIIRIVYISIIVVLLIDFLNITDNMYLMNILPKNILKSCLLIFVAFLSLIQLMFVTTMIVCSVFLKRNSMEVMKEIDWLAIDMKRFLYTGYVRTFLVSIFDVYVFFNVLFSLLYLKLHLSLWISVLITVLIYSFSKAIMRKKLKKSVSIFLLGFSLSLSSIILIIASDSLLIGTIFMYICLVLIAFKNVKARI